jgi:hypothetical protein
MHKNYLTILLLTQQHTVTNHRSVYNKYFVENISIDNNDRININ